MEALANFVNFLFGIVGLALLAVFAGLMARVSVELFIVGWELAGF